MKEVEFLGLQILRGKIRIGNKSRIKFKEKASRLTKRNNPLSMYQIIQDLNKYIRGWIGYYRIQEFRKILGDLDGWIRSRLRSMQLKKWKRPRKFQRIMVKGGYKPELARRVWIKMNKWQSVNRKEVHFVLNLRWFRKQGLIFLDNFIGRTLELPFGR